jgi:small basic protein (TIGR04137 family)
MECIMSSHPSLKTSGKVQSKRSVMKRFERINTLKAEGRWKEGEKVWGLPKTKVDL